MGRMLLKLRIDEFELMVCIFHNFLEPIRVAAVDAATKVIFIIVKSNFLNKCKINGGQHSGLATKKLRLWLKFKLTFTLDEALAAAHDLFSSNALSRLALKSRFFTKYLML